MAKVLVVDCSEKNREVVDSLRNADPRIRVMVAGSIDEAADLAEEENFDLIVSGMRMPPWSGLHFLSRVRASMGPEVPFILVSQDMTERLRDDAIQSGASACFDRAHLSDLVAHATRITFAR